MNEINFVFFGLVTLLVLVGGIVTVAAKNPIRGAMGLLTTIVGVAGMYLLLSAEFLAAVQIIVYAGAVVVLFLFVIMLLGPSAVSGRDTRTWGARYLAAGVFLASSVAALVLLKAAAGAATTTAFGPAPRGLGTIEGIGHELFTTALVPFELSSALLLVAVVGAVAVARGKQVDPTLLPDKKPVVGAPGPGEGAS
jgi:NADH-quinone oxidoreductase subunit J